MHRGFFTEVDGHRQTCGSLWLLIVADQAAEPWQGVTRIELPKLLEFTCYSMLLHSPPLVSQGGCRVRRGG